MSGNPYIGQDVTPPEMEKRVQEELTPHEHVVWIGRPRPDRFQGQTIGGVLAGVFILGISGIVFTAFIETTLHAGKPAQVPPDPFAGMFSVFATVVVCLFAVPFMLLGGWMLLAPLWMPRWVRRIIYALSNHRALLFEPNWFIKGYTVRSYTHGALGRMFRVDRRGDSGDLVLEEYYVRTTDASGGGGTARKRRGFMGIDQAREVEELVRRTLNV
jgi:hypothetical protein